MLGLLLELLHTHYNGQTKTLMPPNSGRNVKHQEVSFIAGGIAKWYSYFEDSLAFSYKTKHTHVMQPSNYIPWYLVN